MKQIKRKGRLGERKKDQRRGKGIKCCQIKKVWKNGSQENEKEMYECEKRNRKKKTRFQFKLPCCSSRPLFSLLPSIVIRVWGIFSLLTTIVEFSNHKPQTRGFSRELYKTKAKGRSPEK